MLIAVYVCSPQTDREKDPDYDSLPSQTSQSESSMLQVICRPEATNKEEAYTFHTVHSECQEYTLAAMVWRLSDTSKQRHKKKKVLEWLQAAHLSCL